MFFKVNKNLSAINQTRLIIKYINKQANKKKSEKQIIFLSSILDIPRDVIKFEFKKYLSLNYNFKENKFNKNKLKIQNLKLRWLLPSIFYYYLNLIIFYLFSENFKHKKKIQILFDEVFSEVELERAEIFLKKTKSFKIVSKIKKKNKNIINYLQYVKFSKNYLYKNFYNFLIKIPYHVFLSSLKDSVNYFPFYDYAMKKNIKYETLFQQYRSNILIQERPYSTSAIKNYLFKKYGGKKTCCFQRILFHLANTSFFINTDILFSLGKMSAKSLSLTGAKIGQIKPLGSYTYFSKWINSKKIKTKKYDIIYLNGNNVPAYGLNNRFLKNYYTQLNWLRKISLKNPKLKILMKHHRNNVFHDPEELKILKDTNIVRLSGETYPDKYNNSYGYAINAKLRLTWCSTMAYELIGHNHECYFLDPNHENLEFLQNYDFNKKYRIKNFYDFEKKIKEVLIKKRKSKILNSENFCINSNNFLNKFIMYTN